MTQITYQAALDPFHAVFRFLRLREVLSSVGPQPRDMLRILDFYLLFPFRIDNIRLYPKHRGLKKLASKYNGLKPYGELPDSIALFERMEPMETAALETMVNHQIFDQDAFLSGMIALTPAAVAEEIQQRVDLLNSSQVDILNFLKILASEYPLRGQDGLKDRTGLLEYRYDTV